ncbi:MAG: acyl-CoA carboxylase subunit beta [Myxococcales bacterium]|nr:acyl-CoA carboxylase subunit beta [Myxococcales bacterium]
MEEKLKRLDELNARAELGGGARRIERQHKAGKLTARERIDILVDPGTFQEYDRLRTTRGDDVDEAPDQVLGDGVVTGAGQIHGRLVFVFAHDATVFGGSLALGFGAKVCKIMDHAARVGAPMIGLNESGGARIPEGVTSLAAYGDIFLRNVQQSGVIPQISAVMGACAGGSVYSPTITDFVVMVKGTSNMFITGPDVIRTVTHEEVSKEDLGGAMVHNARSGVAHFAVENDRECLTLIRSLLSFIPQNNLEDPPFVATEDPADRRDPRLSSHVPENPSKPYDMSALVRMVTDDGQLLQVHEHYARNIIVGFARFGGRSVGVVANQPAVMAGSLDINASVKAARFVRFCDAFNIPLVTFVDVPGYLPGTQQEHDGIIRHGAKLLYAFAEATVPKVTVITRKGYGGAYDVMSSKHLGGDVSFCYPQAEIAVMGPDGAVNVVFREELANADDPEARRRELTDEYRRRFAHPYKAAALGYVDEVIRPEDTRPRVIATLQILENKKSPAPQRKHGNIPL